MNNALHAAGAVHSPRLSRRWLWAALFVGFTALTVWGTWAVGSTLWAEVAGLHSDFDVTVNGETWSGNGLGSLIGWAIGATVVAVLLVVALTVVLPMALGAVLLGVLLLVSLVVGIIALPVLLVLAVVLSPLLALAGLAWMLFA